MKTIFTKMSFIQVNRSSFNPRASLTNIMGPVGVPKRGGKNLTYELRRDVPEITYFPSLMSVSGAALELESSPSVHPYGGGKWDWAAKSYLNDSANSHPTVLGGYQATVSKASWQFFLGFLSPFQSIPLCLACALYL